MGKYCVDRERIDRLCRLSGVNYSKKTVENFKGFLETYYKIRDDLKYLPKGFYSDEIWKEAPDLFKAMALKQSIPENKREAFLALLIRSGHFDDILTGVFESIKSFSADGENYYQILYMLYFDDEPHKNIEIEKKIGYSHTAYQEKKELAITLFGLMFWKRFLDHWDNSTEEMYKIEKSIGRDGSLSDRKFAEENKDRGIVFTEYE